MQLGWPSVDRQTNISSFSIIEKYYSVLHNASHILNFFSPIADSDSSSSSSDESHSDGNDSSQESEEPSKKEEEEGVPRKRRKLTLDETEIRIPLEHGYVKSGLLFDKKLKYEVATLKFACWLVTSPEKQIS